MKSATQAMQYELAGSKKVNGSSLALKAAKNVNSFSLLWVLVHRHRVGLLFVGNVILVLNWAIPAWPQIVRSFF